MLHANQSASLVSHNDWLDVEMAFTVSGPPPKLPLLWQCWQMGSLWASKAKRLDLQIFPAASCEEADLLALELGA